METGVAFSIVCLAIVVARLAPGAHDIGRSGRDCHVLFALLM
jgi:hypothetical protein